MNNAEPLTDAELEKCGELIAPSYGVTRCEVCGWTLAKDATEGCVPGNCCFRPAEHSQEAACIRARRLKLRLLHQAAEANRLRAELDGVSSVHRDLAASEQIRKQCGQRIAALEEHLSIEKEWNTGTKAVIASLEAENATLKPPQATHEEGIGEGEIRWLWHEGYYDGPLSGLGLLRGEKVRITLAHEQDYCCRQRTYAIDRMPAEWMEYVERRHADLREMVGTHTDYIYGEDGVRKREGECHMRCAADFAAKYPRGSFDFEGAAGERMGLFVESGWERFIDRIRELEAERDAAFARRDEVIDAFTRLVAKSVALRAERDAAVAEAVKVEREACAAVALLGASKFWTPHTIAAAIRKVKPTKET